MAKNTNMNVKKKKVSTGPKKPKAQFSKIKQNLSNKKDNVIARVETEIKNKKKTKEEKPKTYSLDCVYDVFNRRCSFLSRRVHLHYLECTRIRRGAALPSKHVCLARYEWRCAR